VHASTGPKRQVDDGDLAASSETLPRGPVENGDTANTSQGLSPGSKRILVVDDSAEIREYIAKLVSREGFVADTAEDGEEGWRHICSTGYELLITDHQMPRLTGLSLIRRLREVSSKAPCILISSSLPEPELTLTQLIDPGAVLTKPFKPAELIEAVHSLLRSGADKGLDEP